MTTTLSDQFEDITLRNVDRCTIVRLPRAQAHAEDVAALVADRGLCVIEDFFETGELTAIAQEYRQTLARGKAQHSPYWNYVESPLQHQAHAVDNLDPEGAALASGSPVCPDVGLPDHWQLSQMLKSPFLQRLAKTYFGDTPYLYPVRIQFVKTLQFAKGASQQIPFVPHADRQRFLKFFIYLSEMDQEMGPLRVLPIRGAALNAIESQRQRQFAAGRRWFELNTRVDANEEDFVDVIAPPNAMVIFDSNLPHLAKHKISARPRDVVMIELQTVAEYRRHGRPTWL